MVDKLHNYQGAIGQLHTIRDNVKTKIETWKENHSNLDTKKIIEELVLQKASPKDSKDGFEYSHIFRRKTRWELVRLCATVMGIEFSYAAITAFSTPILLEIGVQPNLMSLVFTLSPILGFFLSPVTGSLSDRCESRFGRRRIFIVLFTFFDVIGLLLIPHGKDIGNYISNRWNLGAQSTSTGISKPSNSTFLQNFVLENDTYLSSISPPTAYSVPLARGTEIRGWVVVLTIIGIVMADYLSDGLQNPSRAYLLDVCEESDHTRGLSTFTILAGCGGTVGYAMGAIDWDNIFLGRFFGGHVKTVFWITTVMFILCVFISITTFREIPLNSLNKVEKQYREVYAQGLLDTAQDDMDMEKSPKKYIPANDDYAVENKMEKGLLRSNSFTLNERKSSTGNNIKMSAANEKLLLSHQMESMTSKESVPSLAEYLSSIVKLPYSIRILLVTNVLCWMSHVSYSLYFTDYVGEAIFKGNPTALDGHPEKILYETGVRFACWGMMVYSFSCLLCSLYMEKVIERYGLKIVYIFNILIDTVSMFFMFYFNEKTTAILFSFSSGILYCTIFTVPYIIVARYHTLNVFEVDRNGEYVPCKQVRGLGTDISIIGSSVFIAQFILSLFMGTIVGWCGSTAAVPMLCCILSGLAAVAASQVIYLDL